VEPFAASARGRTRPVGGDGRRLDSSCRAGDCGCEISVGTQSEPGLVSFREAVRYIDAGDVDVSRLVTHRVALEQLNDAFALANEPDGGAIKVSITFD
jgi:hypothetical protein